MDTTYRDKLIKGKVLSEKAAKQINKEADDEVEAALTWSMDSPFPERSLLNEILYAK